MKAPTCERNMAGPEEDIGFRIAYEPCGEPATATVDPDGREWHACAEHAREAELDGLEVSR